MSLVRMIFLPFLKNRIGNFPEVVDMNDQGASTAVTLPDAPPERVPVFTCKPTTTSAYKAILFHGQRLHCFPGSFRDV